MSKEQLYRVACYAGGSLIDVGDGLTEEIARISIDDWNNDELGRTSTCQPPLPIVESEGEQVQDNKVLPTPMSLFSFETSFGEILIASDDEVSARTYANSIAREYSTITGEAVTLAEPNNVGPVHAVFISGQSLTDYLDPAELAEFDHPGITTD